MCTLLLGLTWACMHFAASNAVGSTSVGGLLCSLLEQAARQFNRKKCFKKENKIAVKKAKQVSY